MTRTVNNQTRFVSFVLFEGPIISTNIKITCSQHESRQLREGGKGSGGAGRNTKQTQTNERQQ